jgi:hypothetical protein
MLTALFVGDDIRKQTASRLGKHFMEPTDDDGIPPYKILYFVRGTGLLTE